MNESKALAHREEGSSLVAVGEPFELTREDVKKQAGLLKGSWGKTMDLGEDDFEAIVTLSAACGMNPIFDVDVLDGAIYDKSDFWKGLLTGHPNVKAIDGPHRIEFGTPEWDELICISDPEVVAAAYYIEVHLHDRGLPQREGQYVTKDDAILWRTEWDHEQGFGKERDSRKKALEYAGEHGKTFWVKPGDAKPWKPEGWHGAPGKLRKDWEGMAAKKCRTTVWRRVGKVTVPRAHARVLQFHDQVERLIEAREASSAGATAHVPEDPFEEPKPEPIRVTADEVEVGGAPSSTISERDRKMVMGQATRKGLKMPEVKAILRKVRGLPELAGVHLSSMTYAEMTAVIDIIDQMDEPDHEVKQAPESAPEPEPAQQGDGPSPTLWPDDEK